MLRRVFGSKRVDVTGEWRKLHNEELSAEYCTGSKIEKNEMGGACGAYGAGERSVQGSGGNPEGRRPMGRPRRRWEDNIKMDLQEVGRGCGDWIGTGGGHL